MVILVDINSSIVCGCHLGTCVDLYLNWIYLLKTEQNRTICTFSSVGLFAGLSLMDRNSVLFLFSLRWQRWRLLVNLSRGILLHSGVWMCLVLEVCAVLHAVCLSRWVSGIGINRDCFYKQREKDTAVVQFLHVWRLSSFQNPS